jgi:hypothetical protein
MEIKPIQIREIYIPTWNFNSPSISLPSAVPVTVQIGLPIVDIPGCVETRETEDLKEVDPRGNKTFCDGQIPSYDPIEFQPNQLIPTGKPKVDTRQPKAPPAPELPATPKIPPATAKVDCPTAAQEAKEPVGTFVEGFRKKVTDYKLIGNECIQITEPVPLPQQIIAGLPSPGSVVTTGGIAVVATASALMAKPLADILLKVVKPTVKKVMKKIAAIRGKSVPVLSVRDRQDLQRERSHAIRVLRQTLKPKG